MATTTNLDTLKINYLTQAQYDTAAANNQINSNELYFTPSAGDVVEQNNISTNANYRLLLSNNASDTNEIATVKKNNNLMFNPNSSVLYLGSQGSGASATSSYVSLSSENLSFWKTGTSDGRAINYDKIVKLDNFGSDSHVNVYGSSTTVGSTDFVQLSSFSITEAGTYLVTVHMQYPKSSTSTNVALRLCTSSSTSSIHSSAEATGITHNVGLSEPCHIGFTGIFSLTAQTYRIMAKAGASLSGCYGGYSYIRLL